MRGRWVGLGHDGKIMTGFSGLARAKDDVPAIIEDLKVTEDDG